MKMRFSLARRQIGSTVARVEKMRSTGQQAHQEDTTKELSQIRSINRSSSLCTSRSSSFRNSRYSTLHLIKKIAKDISDDHELIIFIADEASELLPLFDTFSGDDSSGSRELS